MGEVYAAKHTATGRQLAVKVVRNQLLRNDLARDKFSTEVQVGGVIGESYYIVEVSDAGFDDEQGVPYLVMPLLRGEALDAKISRGRLDPKLVVRLMSHLAKALDQAHDANVVHRDIKPSNLFVVQDHEGLPLLKVLDFGIAKVVSGQGDMTATELGTPAYRAPEQLAKPHRPRPRPGLGRAIGGGSRLARAAAPAGAVTGRGAAGVASARRVRRLVRVVPGARCVPTVPAGIGGGVGARSAVRWQAGRGEALAGRRGRHAARWRGVGTYGPGDPVVRAAPAQPPPEQGGKGTSLAGAVDSFAPGMPGAAMTTGGAGVATKPAQRGAKRPGRRGLVAAGGGGLPALVGLSAWALTRSEPPAVTDPASSVSAAISSASASAAPVDSAKLAAERAKEAAERKRVGASVAIPGGTFVRGSKSGEPDEKPTRPVTVESFDLDVDEVTVERFAACVKAGACEAQSTAKGKALGEGKVFEYWNSRCNFGVEGRDRHPMNCVDWKQASAFCSWVGKRLPTEVEWEYAARAGTTTAFHTGRITQPTGRDPNLNRAGWYDENSGSKTHPVGQKAANAWGLYDMHGNVYEWVWDWYDDYGSGKQTDPVGPSSGTLRVRRGGSWYYGAGFCRSAVPNASTPGYRDDVLGFRLSRSIP